MFDISNQTFADTKMRGDCFLRTAHFTHFSFLCLS